MRREIPLAITFLIGVFMLVDFFVPHHAVSSAAEEMKQWGTIVIAASILLGVGNLIRVHFHKIRRRREGWGYSIVTLAIMGVMFAFGGPWGTIEEGSVFNWMFLNMQVPLQSTMFSLLAFFIASAAYRAFRLRSAEASLLLPQHRYLQLQPLVFLVQFCDDLPFLEVVAFLYVQLLHYSSCLRLDARLSSRFHHTRSLHHNRDASLLYPGVAFGDLPLFRRAGLASARLLHYEIHASSGNYQQDDENEKALEH